MRPFAGNTEEPRRLLLSERTAERRQDHLLYAMPEANGPAVQLLLTRAVPHRKDAGCCSRRRSRNDDIVWTLVSEWEPLLIVTTFGWRQLDHRVEGDIKVGALLLRFAHQISVEHPKYGLVADDEDRR